MSIFRRRRNHLLERIVAIVSSFFSDDALSDQYFTDDAFADPLLYEDE